MNILTTQATDDDTLATEAGNPYPIHLLNPASLVALLRNFQYTINPALIGPVVAPGFSGPAFASQTGQVLVVAMVTVQGGGNATAGAGDAIQVQGLVDGGLVGPTWDTELGATQVEAPGMYVYVANVSKAPATHTFGIQAKDTTHAGDTLNLLQGTAAIFVMDL